jgi:hypothetical protein
MFFQLLNGDEIGRQGFRHGFGHPPCVVRARTEDDQGDVTPIFGTR